MLIKACLNGRRTRDEHPAVPLQPREIARAAHGAMAAGASAIHIHPRRPDGAETLEPGPCAETIRAVRAIDPVILIGITTGAWIEPDPARRLATIRAWEVRPDFASVNFSEDAAVELCWALLQMGIGIEPGLSTADDARLLVASGLAERCLRVLIEPEQHDTVEDALATTAEIERVLDGTGIHTARLLHGYGSTAWPLLEIALQRGYDARIGFEDALTLPDGRPASDNAQLVMIAREWAIQAGRLPAPHTP